MRLSPGDAGVLAAVRANGPGTLAHCLGRFPTVLEAQAAGRLWEAGLVTRDMAGVYAAVADPPAGGAVERSPNKSAPAVLERGIVSSHRTPRQRGRLPQSGPDNYSLRRVLGLDE